MFVTATRYFYRTFKHDIEDEGPLWPKAIVITSLTLTQLSVLLPPLDIANGNGGIPMDIIWYVVFYIQTGMVILVIPYAIFYYAAYDSLGQFDENGNLTPPSKCQMDAIRGALCYTGIAVAMSGTLIGVVWLFLGRAEIEVSTFSGGLLAANAVKDITSMGCTKGEQPSVCNSEEVELTMDVTFPVYTIAIVAFAGWFFFTLFAGVGFFSVPMDLINYFRRRISFMSFDSQINFKQKLGEKAVEVEKILRDMHESINQAEKMSKNDEKVIKEALEEKQIILSQFNNYKLCVEAVDQEDNVLWHYAALAAGILSWLISVAWVLHVVLFMLPNDYTPVYGFLNLFLVELDQNVWGFLGVTMYAVFSFYLMLCVIKGDSKIGLGIGICTLHPLEVKKTLMASFLVNCQILALSSFACIQFCLQAFRGYAGPNSAATLIFNVAARNLTGITYVYKYNIFVYSIVGLAFLTFVWLCTCCAPRRMNLDTQLERANRDGSDMTRGIEIELEARRN
jgi:LMBR1 domain-containing protein 1